MVRSLLLTSAVAAVFVSAWVTHPAVTPAPFVTQDSVPNTLELSPSSPFVNSFASSDTDDYVHSAALTQLSENTLISVWFAGSREGARDVQIRSARFDTASEKWDKEEVLATRESTQQGVNRYIRKLGNPVIALAPDQRLWLFYVAVSVGGWGGSSINAMVSEDMGESWSTPRPLITSPFFNISTLVRSAPVFHEDGSIGLPVYHEFIGKFAEYLYLSPNGEVIDKIRISRGNHSLQPSVVPTGPSSAVAMMRYAGNQHHRVLASTTEDAGRTWSTPVPLQPFNPNSSLAAALTHRNTLLVALNNLREGRFRLSLYETDLKMEKWDLLIDLDESPDPQGAPMPENRFAPELREQFIASSGRERNGLLDSFMTQVDERMCRKSGCEFEYEYPYLVHTREGIFHLVYSWNNSFIKHVSFTEDWLESRH
ncbi:MAG: sialidase family protein [Pseudomonadota bacterium]